MLESQEVLYKGIQSQVLRSHGGPQWESTSHLFPFSPSTGPFAGTFRGEISLYIAKTAFEIPSQLCFAH